VSAPVLVEIRPLPGQRLEPSDGLTVGRQDSDVMLAHPQVSRHHARFHVRGDRIVVEDLGSRNGTFVNAERLDTPRELALGDVVRIGETEWQVEVAPAATAAGAQATQARGDVPPPPSPSLVGPMPPIPAVATPQFVEAPRRRGRASAARRIEATVISYAVVATTAAGVIAYLAAR
jgi:hypothetical protein